MSKNSKVLALKYRPQRFEDLIGQDVVAKTIKNSIELNKIPNAYLFTGIRGVGKTTIARIVSKALNCKNGLEKLCKDNFCESCEAIINSNHIDVLEMDAASKTGVEDVRDLIEFSRYGPTSAKYKIFIIDEVHMLSKQAFNALLKTLEEPPEYLKFIFATTEIKKIPVTVLSRCQRFDLTRIKSEELFHYLKKIAEIEKGKISDEVLRLIVKMSEGSVRDSLSLLDRGLISEFNGEELDLETAQKIYGYFDKNHLITLFKYLFEGNENEVIKIYRSIYNQGVEPKVFLNDFLELLYYFKNISSLKLSSKNFNLNDDEFNKISELSSYVSPNTLILFWQFTIKTMDELNIVSDQNLSIQMFLIRLLYLKEFKQDKEFIQNEVNYLNKQTNVQDNIFKTLEDNSLPSKNKTISQIKNISQEHQTNPSIQTKKNNEKIEINNFDDLLKIADQKKEAKLKYELKTNVNLVSFENQRIEISFNENLDKKFVKDLSLKLYEWTNSRWIISFSQKNGQPTKKQIKKENRSKLFEEVKNSQAYKKLIEIFPDAELIDFEMKDKND